ncbi:MAG TPA: chorismate mutase [Arsenophonus apicola]|uniref:chorismate mutase n=1 Tax=Arsenophonus TaxID=637 RepID=UPI0015D8560B|nr:MULTISPECIES: chorismate mutase [Arsenophonus]UBX28050.1 chorismate mutase [Arsenophonus apicola]
MINNLKRYKPCAVILKYSLSTLFFISFTATAHQYQKIAVLIEQRLSYMKYVAKYKFEKHLSVEDHTQENKVILNSINKAETLGLDKKSIEPFMISQINAAKAIQYRYKADWLSMPETINQYDDLKDIRLKISKLSDDILLLIANELKRNGQIKNQICLYINKIQLHNLKDADKKIICSSLKQISLKNKNSN